MGKAKNPWPECELVLPASAPRPEWLKGRSIGLGGSDMVILMGHSYKGRTEYRLWLEKTGQLGSEESGVNIRMRRGNHMEAFIAREFEQLMAEAFGVASVDQVGLVRHVEHEMAVASADYRVSIGDGRIEGVECKHVDNYGAAKAYRRLNDNDEPVGSDAAARIKQVAPRFYWQCVHYLMVTGAPGWWLAIDSPFYDELVVAYIDRLEVTVDIDRVRQKAISWWTRHIELGLPVDPIGEELKAELGELLEDTVEATVPWQLADDLERWKELAYPGTAAGKAELEEIKARVKDQIGSHKLLTLDGDPVVRWQRRRNPGGLMKEELERDHPGLLAQYTRTGGTSEFLALVRSDREAPKPGGRS